MKHNDQMKENKTQVRDVILRTVKTQKLLSAGIVITVVGAIIAALIPPLILAEIVDTITEGNGAPLFLILSYFGMIVITGMTESAREGLLTVFGQKITHALRSSMMKKFISLTADNINRQEPGTVKDQITLYDEGITDEQVREVIGLVGLKEAVEGLENGVDTWCTAELFSQGQWQLLSVARAAVAGPAILLLDEITANLDAETEQNVLMALKKVSKDRTVISISHRMTASMGRTIFIS